MDSEAEERGQGEAIARNIYEMSGLRVPVVSIIMEKAEVAEHLRWPLQMKYGCWKIPSIPSSHRKDSQVSLERQLQGQRSSRSDEIDGRESERHREL